ncbi:MAG: carbohydrate ABC transporter permease [Spirochaetales bacterium]
MKSPRFQELAFQGAVLAAVTAFAFLCFYPFYYMAIYSLSDPAEVVKTRLYWLPVGFTFSNYIELISLKGVALAAVISVSRTVLGTLVTVLVSALFAYALTKVDLPFRKVFYRFAVISMYVNAGLIPWYVVMFKLGLKDNYLVYILPYAVSVFFVMIIKTSIEQLPTALEESAVIDGANVWTIFWKIILPLVTPILAAVAVFSAVGQWNNWTDNFFLVRDPNLQTLQMTLMRYLMQADALAQQARSGVSAQNLHATLSPIAIKMTLTVIVALPIVIVYPLMQKYFVKGLLIGAVKG